MLLLSSICRASIPSRQSSRHQTKWQREFVIKTTKNKQVRKRYCLNYTFLIFLFFFSLACCFYFCSQKISCVWESPSAFPSILSVEFYIYYDCYYLSWLHEKRENVAGYKRRWNDHTFLCLWIFLFCFVGTTIFFLFFYIYVIKSYLRAQSFLNKTKMRETRQDKKISNLFV